MTPDNIKEKLMKKANKITFLLEDSLGDSLHFWKPFNGYKICLSNSEYPRCIQNKFPQVLFLREDEKDFAIAHEIGHCLHYRANTRLPEILDKRLILLQETVADYFELLYYFGEDPINNNGGGRFNLPFLCNIGLVYERQINNHKFTHEVTFDELKVYDARLNTIKRKEGLI